MLPTSFLAAVAEVVVALPAVAVVEVALAAVAEAILALVAVAVVEVASPAVVAVAAVAVVEVVGSAVSLLFNPRREPTNNPLVRFPNCHEFQ